MRSIPYKYKAIVIALIFAGQFFSINAQKYSELEDQAKLLLTYEEYDMALQLYDSLYLLDPYNPTYSQSLGDCYLQTSKYEEALKCYKRSIPLSKISGEIYYKIGSTFDHMDMADSAIFYFKKYISGGENKENTFNRIAILYMGQEESQDSSLVYAQKALSAEPDKASSYYTLSMVYIGLSRLEDAIFTGLAGIKKDPDYPLLYMPVGLAYYQQEKYEKAVEYFEKGWKTPGLEEMFVNYLAISKLHLNTEPGKVTLNDGDMNFVSINFKNMNKVIENFKNPQNEYYYPYLLKSFKSEFSGFGLDDFAMLYLGFSSDISYQPYENNLMDLSTLWENENFEELYKYAQRRLDSVPVDFPLYWPLAKIAASNGDYLSQLDNLIKYFGFSQAVTATGDGNSIDSPFIIAYIQHEYEIMYQLELEVLEQHLETNKNNNFDVILAKDLQETTQEIYFNVDLPFSSFEEILKPSKERRREKGRINA